MWLETRGALGIYPFFSEFPGSPKNRSFLSSLSVQESKLDHLLEDVVVWSKFEPASKRGTNVAASKNTGRARNEIACMHTDFNISKCMSAFMCTSTSTWTWTSSHTHTHTHTQTRKAGLSAHGIPTRKIENNSRKLTGRRSFSFGIFEGNDTRLRT
jgi:hypothetical protein